MKVGEGLAKSAVDKNTPVVPDTGPETHAVSLAGQSTPEAAADQPVCTPDGHNIPGEYSRTFHPQAFSWSAFWFADLWHADKGFLPKAWRHFAFRTVSTIIGVALLIFGVGSSIGQEGEPSQTDLAWIGVLALAWLASLAVNFTMSYIDARGAYGRYADVVSESTPNQLERRIVGGRRAYWTMLYVPFALFIVAFLIMLMTASDYREHIDKVPKAGKFLLSLFSL